MESSYYDELVPTMKAPKIAKEWPGNKELRWRFLALARGWALLEHIRCILSPI